MSVDMNSQGSDSNEEDYDPNCEEEEEDEDPGDIEDYYVGVASDVEQQGADAFDPEEYQFTCLTYKESEGALNEHMTSLASVLKVSHSVAKLILVNFHWQVAEILDRYKSNSAQLLVEARVQPSPSKHVPAAHPPHHCAVCMQFVRKEHLLSLACQHQFCRSCWEQHCSVLVRDGVGVGVSCMAQDCPLRTPEDFVFPLLPNEELRDKYRRYLFRDYVESHYQLQLCPGADCPMVIQVQEPRARRVQCSRCSEVFCFKCRQMYHAPTDCATIRKWLTKCADDSETANYISAHTKDCPKCNICIEKNGGCNHMQCSKCKHDFCWMCLGDWKTHGSEYYECSRYKENPDIVNQSQQAQAREALKKYLFYFERWENHNKSLQLEAQTYQRIHEKIQERVMNNLGTWIDWQYLQNAAKLLAKCRYTLQYTYPYAYYMESGPRKKLFEYQQAQLEAEIENLSWKVERAPLPLLAAQVTMGAPRLSAFHILQALCVLLTLLEDGPQSTRASACPRCPANSSCVNGTSCRCNLGFKSSSGEIDISYKDRCEDVDECEQRGVKACGRVAECHNTVGSYYCTCIPGYRLVSGAAKFSDASENTCQDMDECLNPRICKSLSECVNTLGSYTCTCPPGFELNLEDPKLCKDVNECTSGRKPCHKTTHCLNNVGSYKCRCRPGWKPIPGSPNGPNNTVCEDVNECTSGEHICHNSTQCHNTEGSYECHCRSGWKPIPGSPNGPHNTVCEQEIFPTRPLPPGIKSQSLSNFFEKVQELSRDFKPASAQDTIHKFITSLDELEVAGDLEALALSDRHRMATHLLSYLEEVLRNLAKTLPEPSFTYHSPLDTELSLMIQEQRNGTVTLGQSHARMKLNWTQAAGVGDSGPTVAGIFSSRKMETLLVNASVVLDPEKKAQLEETYESSVNDAQSKLLSTVNTVFLSNKNTEKLDPPVTFSFSYHPETPKSRQELICAFWKGNDSGGYWSTTGCKKLGSSNNSITCQCSHLSSFAVLMAHYDVEDPKLALITKVGLALSLVCLLLCILTFLLVRPIQGSRTTVHLHLCICLFLGSAIFLAGIENEGGEVGLRCRLVAGLLHYCFLAAFCWMSLEGLELYFLVVRVFQGQGLSKRWLYLIGYGVPFLIVAISAAARPEGYGRDIYCWLDPARGFLWSFVGPVTFIILCNAVIFVITVWKLTKKFSEINPDMKKLKKARVLTITAIAQLLVLGCTWVFGLFLFDPRSRVLAYAFTILNCLQGFFLFLLHCLLNKKVREEYQKWACMVTGNKYSDFGTSTSSSSHNQTRVLRPSESGM